MGTRHLYWGILTGPSFAVCAKKTVHASVLLAMKVEDGPIPPTAKTHGLLY
jgi:hypothetical protein